MDMYNSQIRDLAKKLTDADMDAVDAIVSCIFCADLTALKGVAKHDVLDLHPEAFVGYILKSMGDQIPSDTVRQAINELRDEGFEKPEEQMAGFLITGEPVKLSKAHSRSKLKLMDHTELLKSVIKTYCAE